MKIEIIKCLEDNYSYLIIDEKNKTACVVDPLRSGTISPVRWLELMGPLLGLLAQRSS